MVVDIYRKIMPNSLEPEANYCTKSKKLQSALDDGLQYCTTKNVRWWCNSRSLAGPQKNLFNEYHITSLSDMCNKLLTSGIIRYVPGTHQLRFDISRLPFRKRNINTVHAITGACVWKYVFTFFTWGVVQTSWRCWSATSAVCAPFVVFLSSLFWKNQLSTRVHMHPLHSPHHRTERAEQRKYNSVPTMVLAS